MNIKSAVTAAEIARLAALAAGKRVVEVGSLLGFSTVHLARAACRVVAIDPHDGYPYYNPSPTLPEFLGNLERFGVLPKVDVRVGYAQDWLPKLSEKHGSISDNFGLTFIDATGFYEDTKFCLAHAPSPVIAVHDYGRRGCGGVEKAVKEFCWQTGKSFDVTGTLAVIQ